jgi:signal transduction histidine kinase
LDQTPSTFSAFLAERLRAGAVALSALWLDRLRTLLPVEADRIFPTDSLLDDVPRLIEAIGDLVGSAEPGTPSGTLVLSEARSLGALRHRQRASVHQLLREYEILRGILEEFVVEQARLFPGLADTGQVIQALRRINAAVATLAQTTVDTFIAHYTETIQEQQHRLEGFNRMLSHELRQPLGVLVTAMGLLKATEGTDDGTRRASAMAAVERTTMRLMDLVSTITRLSMTSAAADLQPNVQRISLTAAARDAARPLLEWAAARQVDVRIDPGLADVVVDMGRLGLMLTNLLSNGIKYSDPSKAGRFVEVRRVEGAAVAFQVHDNGIGMDPAEARQVFTPFYRGEAARDRGGLGLGLAIVQECATAMGATLTVDSVPGQGSTFTVALPEEPPA